MNHVTHEGVMPHINESGRHVSSQVFPSLIVCNTLQHTATGVSIAQRQPLSHAATHCNTLQHIATHCNTLQHTATGVPIADHQPVPHAARDFASSPPRTPHRSVAVCCRVLQCVAVCCSVLQCFAGCHNVLQCVAVFCRVLQGVAVCCRV